MDLGVQLLFLFFSFSLVLFMIRSLKRTLLLVAALELLYYSASVEISVVTLVV